MTKTLGGMHVAVLVAPGFDQDELDGVLLALRRAGANGRVVAHRHESVPGRSANDWCDVLTVDTALDGAAPETFDALIIPEQHVPAALRQDEAAIDFVRRVARHRMPIGAVGNGVGALIDAGLVRGRRVAAGEELREEVERAGGHLTDEVLALDGALVTARDRDGLPAFCRVIVHELERRVAAGVRAALPPPPASNGGRWRRVRHLRPAPIVAVPAATPTAPAPRPRPVEAHTIDGYQVPMRWDEAGEGVPVVFVHGLATSPALWRYVLPRLPGCRCLAWEMVGHGHSIPAGRGRALSLDRQADYLLGWLELLGVSRAILVGHDLGGGVVQIAATRQPARCAGLVLTNTLCYDARPIPRGPAARPLAPLLRRLPDRAFQALLSRLLRRGHDDDAVGRESAAIHLEPYLAHGGAAALVSQLRDLDVEETRRVAPILGGLATLPTQVVWGTADGFRPIEHGERLARDLGAPITRIEGGRHFVPEDHPRAIADAVVAVVRDAAWRDPTRRQAAAAMTL